jgi:hypothetical protein
MSIMPLGEIFTEILRSFVFECVVLPLAYSTGALVILILTLGKVNLAPLCTIRQTNPNKNMWNDCSIWLQSHRYGKALRAEFVCLVGVLVWIAFGVGIFFAFRGVLDRSSQDNAVSAPTRQVESLILE